MIKDIILSFKDNLKQKSTNPFFGTLIIVWIIHNWEFLFTIFNFGKFKKFEDKVVFLETLLSPLSFIKNLAECIMIAFLVIIASYFLINLSRLIINVFEKKLTPWIFKISDKSSIVLKSEYTKIKNERDVLVQKIETERDLKLKYRNEIDNLENRIQDLSNVPFDNTIKPSSIQSKTDTKSEKVIEKIISDTELIKLFRTIVNSFYSDDYIELTKENKANFNYLLRNDIIKLKSKHDSNLNYRKYDLLATGKIIKNQILD